jgi:class 3 adenylate cyclase
MNADQIALLIHTHLGEASGRTRDCNVSELKRGECVERDYFIFKIDLADSTAVLHGVTAASHARFAHAYLSSVDKITQEWSADREQTEYHGDSVLAFFPHRGGSADTALEAALRSHYAANYLRREIQLPSLRPRVLLHSARLVVAKIGPWSESHRVAIGLPIHLVAKKEKEIIGGAIWVSDQFADQLDVKVRTKYLARAAGTPYGAASAGQPTYGIPMAEDSQSLSTLLGLSSKPVTYQERLVAALREPPAPVSIAKLFSPSYVESPQAEPRLSAKSLSGDTEQLGPGYFVKLEAAYGALGLPIVALS